MGVSDPFEAATVTQRWSSPRLTDTSTRPAIIREEVSNGETTEAVHSGVQDRGSTSGGERQACERCRT